MARAIQHGQSALVVRRPRAGGLGQRYVRRRRNFWQCGGVETLVRPLVRSLLLTAAVTIAGCGSVPDESEPALSPGAETTLQSTDSAIATTPSANPESTACGSSPVSAAILAEAQFAFIGTVTAVEDAIHPWTTDLENPDRPEFATPTSWVKFDVERWYLNDWGTAFAVWIPDISVNVGQRLAVGGNAYHTEVNGFSGQSGEVEFCSPIADTDATLSMWDEQLGAASPPSPGIANPTTTVALPATKMFGEHGGPCAPTVLNNGPDDQATLAVGAACFLAEHDVGRPVVWDVLIPTVEGDPIVSRYDYDGTEITITTDYTFDTFGTGGVIEERCAGVLSTNWLPDGADCTTSTGEGFRADSLN